MVIAIHRHESLMGPYVSIHPESNSYLPPNPIPLGCPRAPNLSVLLHALNLHWSSILHMVIYMLKCYSLKSSHPPLIPHSAKVCPLHLCLFCCFVYRVIITFFVNSIYMCYYTPILWPPDTKSWLTGKDSVAGKDWGQEEKGTTEDEMVEWHHRLNGHGFGWTLGVGDGQGGLACCSSWGHKESDTTEWLN